MTFEIAYLLGTAFGLVIGFVLGALFVAWRG